VLAWVFVGVGAAMVAYPLISYRIASLRQDRLLELAPEPTRLVRTARSPPDLVADRPREGALLGTIEIPSLGVRAAFLEGTSQTTLMAGPGHLPLTAPPGSSGTSVISAHRDMQFRDLGDLERGGLIVLRTGAGTTRYEVTRSDVVLPDAEWVSEPSGRPMLRLVTCWPPASLGPSSRRLVVSAEPIRGALPAAPAVDHDQIVLRSASLPGLPVPVAWSGTLGAAVGALALFSAARGARSRATFLAWIGGVAVVVVSFLMAAVPPAGP
jgi:sortase A